MNIGRYSLHRFLQLHYIRVFCYQQRSHGVGATRFVVLKASSAIGKPWWPQEFWINAAGSACKSIWSISISNIIKPLCFACFKKPHVYHQDWVYIVVTLALLNRHQWRGVLVWEHPIGLVGLVSLKNWLWNRLWTRQSKECSQWSQQMNGQKLVGVSVSLWSTDDWRPMFYTMMLWLNMVDLFLQFLQHQ